MNLLRSTTVLTLALALWTPIHALAQPAPITAATISPELPSEVVDGKGVALPVNLQASEPPFQFFDDFSWRSFLALNWPATVDVRGLPDTTRQVGDTKGSRVWETWKSAYETIP